MGCLLRSVGLGYTVSLSLLPVLLWFLFYIFKLGKISSSSLLVVLIGSYSVNSCNFDVPMGEGELLCLGCSPMQVIII